MRCNSERAGFASGNRLTKHGKSRCASPPGALGDPLQGSGDRQHRCRDFDAAKDRIFSRDEKIAGQRQFEAAAEGDPLHHSHRRYFEHLDGAIGDVYVRDKRPEPVDVLSRPFPHFTAEAEVRSFGANHKHADVAFAGLATLFWKGEYGRAQCSQPGTQIPGRSIRSILSGPGCRPSVKGAIYDRSPAPLGWRRSPIPDQE